MHPIREGRSDAQIGKKGKSNYRWIVGGKLCFVLNQRGQVVAWEVATANVHDVTFHPLLERLIDESVVLTDSGFHSKDGDPANMKVCKRGTWNVRMVVETIDADGAGFKHLSHRSGNACGQHDGRLQPPDTVARPQPDAHGKLHLSIAEFSL